MKRYLFIAFLLSIIACNNRNIDYQYFVEKDKGEFFDGIFKDNTAYVVGVRYHGKNSWDGNLIIYQPDKDSAKSIFFGDTATEIFRSVENFGKNLLITGSSYDSTLLRIWILITDKNGKILKSHKYSFPSLDAEGIKAILIDKNIYILSSVYTKIVPPQIFLIKTDTNGNIITSKYLKINTKTAAKDLCPYKDGFVITGVTSDINNDDNFFVARINKNLDTLWVKTIKLMLNDRGQKITTDGKYIYIAGYTQSKGSGLSDGWILKFDQNGKLIKDITIGTKYDDWLTGIYLKNNKLTITGITMKKNYPHFFIAKLDTNLNIIESYELKTPNKLIFGLNDTYINDQAIISSGFYFKEGRNKQGWFFIKKY